MNAVETDIQYVQSCTCPPRLIYQTLWDLLCNQLYTQPEPPWYNTEGTFYEVKVWREGEITMTRSVSPYSFTIEIETDRPPKASDIIFYQENYYIIGAVSASSNTYTCTNCVSIDVSIIGVYAALMTLNTTATASEDERVEAESGRVSAEDGRVAAEGQRVIDFSASQAERTLAYNQAEAARDQAFEQAEAIRNAQLESLIAPWIVEGALVNISGEQIFVSDDEEDTPQMAFTKWRNGYRVYLKNRSNRIEEIIADDGDYLITLSGWKWRYTEENNE